MAAGGRRLLVSTANSAFQVLESLRANRAKRHRSRTFLVEGVQPITRALAHGWAFDAVVYESGRRLSAWADEAIARADAPTRYEMTPELLGRLSGRAEGSELLAVVRMAEGGLESIKVGEDLLVIVMDRPASPGNLGTVIRSADALGAHGVVVTGHGVDVYDPATITASRGSLFALPVVSVPSHEEVLGWLRGVRGAVGGVGLVGADERGETELAAHDFRRATVVAFGNEARGLSRAWREACDARVRIPMAGSASSLNVAVAASIALYEAQRQRRAPQAPAR